MRKNLDQDPQNSYSLQSIGLSVALGIVTIAWIYNKFVKNSRREMEEESKNGAANNEQLEETKD